MMREIYIYFCLLPVLSILVMERLTESHHVGENVTFTCSGWDVWTDLQNNVKYLCRAPCNKDKHIIIKAAAGETKSKDGIHLNNTGKSLIVTFTNLQTSDSKKYFCGLERTGLDSYIEVNLKVTEGLKMTPKPVTFQFTSPLVVLNGSTVSPRVSETMTAMSPSNSSSTIPHVSATEGAGGLTYLIIGVVAMLTLLLMALLVLHRMFTRKPPRMDVSSAWDPHEDPGEANTGYEGNRGEHQPVESPAVNTVYTCVTMSEVDSNREFYANLPLHRDSVSDSALQSDEHSEVLYENSASNVPVESMERCVESNVTDPQSDLIYSVAELPTGQIELASHSEPNQLQNNQNDFIYSLVQLP